VHDKDVLTAGVLASEEIQFEGEKKREIEKAHGHQRMRGVHQLRWCESDHLQVVVRVKVRCRRMSGSQTISHGCGARECSSDLERSLRKTPRCIETLHPWLCHGEPECALVFSCACRAFEILAKLK
jgi:hypothetical protein